LAGLTADRLADKARLSGQSQNSLAQRFIEEGCRMDDHAGIVFRVGASGRRPALAGRRIDVSQVVRTFLGCGKSIEETASYLSLSDHQVKAALGYYAEFKGEVDDWIAKEDEFADKAEVAWMREQEVMNPGA